MQDISDGEFQVHCSASAELGEKSSLAYAILEKEALELAITVQKFQN